LPRISECKWKLIFFCFFSFLSNTLKWNEMNSSRSGG
jgi:hypothetical protein